MVLSSLLVFLLENDEIIINNLKSTQTTFFFCQIFNSRPPQFVRLKIEEKTNCDGT